MTILEKLEALYPKAYPVRTRVIYKDNYIVEMVREFKRPAFYRAYYLGAGEFHALKNRDMSPRIQSRFLARTIIEKHCLTSTFK